MQLLVPVVNYMKKQMHVLLYPLSEPYFPFYCVENDKEIDFQSKK